MNEFVARLLASSAALALFSYPLTAVAQSPQGARVVAGSASVQRQGSTTVVTQGTDKGVIDWRSFSIGAGETVRFDQPGRSSVTLNRVTGTEASRLDGSLQANGQVWLANPNGVMIGPSGQVNVGGLLATTGRIDAREFLRSGRAAIDQIDPAASIVNQGAVSIAEGGYVALAAASIRNEGVIAARKGSVVLGAGKAMTVDFTGDKLITFQVTQPLDKAAATSDAMIVSAGTIAAEGGTVLMSARAAKGVIDNAINLKGHVVANNVRVDGGTVTFGDAGIVQVSGVIDASSADGKGGAVAVMGEKVGLMDGARIDASGRTGGGTVLIGGDWQGKGAGQNAAVAYVAPTAAITADARASGDGGKVVVWADGTTRFNGSISARGGVIGGDGGKVETSGKKTLIVGPKARVDASNQAKGARAGSWLLDPADIEITAISYDSGLNQAYGPDEPLTNIFSGSERSSRISIGTLVSALREGDVTIQTRNDAFSAAGDIVVNGYDFAPSTLAYSGAARTLTLKAERNILLSYFVIAGEGGRPAADLSLVLNSGAGAANQAAVNGVIDISGSTLSLAGAHLGAGVNASLAASGPGFAWGVRIDQTTISAGGGVTIAGRGSTNYSIDAIGVGLVNSTIASSAAPIRITGTGGTANLTYGANSALGVSLYNSILSSAGGVTITGTGGTVSGGSGGHIDGVSLDSSQVNATGGGAITVAGALGGLSVASNPQYPYGAGVVMSSSTLSAESGGITVTSAGGTVSGSYGASIYGISINNSTIAATASGQVSINGTGPTITLVRPASDLHFSGSSTGVYVLQSTITGTGGVTITGVGGTISGGTSANASGVELIGNDSDGVSSYVNRIRAGGASDLVISGTGGTASGGRLSNQASGLQLINANELIGAGANTLTGVGGSVIISVDGASAATPGIVMSSAPAITPSGNLANGPLVDAGGAMKISGTGGSVSRSGATEAYSMATGLVVSGATIRTTGGAEISGTGGDGVGTRHYANGVEMNLNTTTRTFDDGRFVTFVNPTKIEGSASSLVKITGRGGSSPDGVTATGIQLSGATMSVAGGAIISGTGGNSASGSVEGLNIGYQSDAAGNPIKTVISGLDAGSITLRGTGGNLSNAAGAGVVNGMQIIGSEISGYGVTLEGTSGAGNIGTFAGVSIIGGFSGGYGGVPYTPIATSISASGAGGLSITGLGASGASGLVSGVRVSAGTLSSAGSVSIQGTGGTLSGTGGAYGLDIGDVLMGGVSYASSIAGGVSGGLLLKGTGGTTAGVGQSHGVNLGRASLFTGGDLTVSGTGGVTTSGYASGLQLVTADLRSQGSIKLIGVGGSSTIASSGSAIGVQLQSSLFTADSGVSIQGSGGSALAADGVNINLNYNGLAVTNRFGSASLSITGTAGVGSAGDGVNLNLGSSTLSGSGAIAIDGQGGGGSGAYNRGVTIFTSTGGLLESTQNSISVTGARGAGAVTYTQGNGNVLITGTGLNQVGTIKAATSLNITGTETRAGAATFNYGVLLAGYATANDISINGVGGNSGANNAGVILGDYNGPANVIATNSVKLKGKAGAGVSAGINAGAGYNSMAVHEGLLQISSGDAVNLATLPIAAPKLALVGLGSFDLTNTGNTITEVAADVGSLRLTNGPAASLTVGSVIDLAITGVTARNGLTISQLGADQSLIINQAITANSVTLSSDATITGDGMVTAATSPMVVSATGGAINATVAGNTGEAAANLISVPSGTITANGVTRSGVVAPPPSRSPAPSLPSPVAPIPVVPVPIVAPPITPAPTPPIPVPPVPVAPPPPPIAAPVVPPPPPAPKPSLIAEPKSPPVEVAAPVIGGQPVATVVTQITAVVSANSAPAPSLTVSGRAPAVVSSPSTSSTSPASPTVTASSVVAAVTATASGALVPPSPPQVGATGATLASAPTIKVDAADTGGANGQVVASASNGSSTPKSVVPGLVKEAPPSRPPRAEPPLADQPSQMNEEAFLD